MSRITSKMSKIFVTGGTGFIGSNLVRNLYEKNKDITVYADIPMHSFLKNLKIKIVENDIRDYEALSKSMEGHDYIYHLAACSKNNEKDKEEIFSVNVEGTDNVMRAALENNAKKVVHVSSCSALGFSRNEKKPLNESDILEFTDQIYGQSKKHGEDRVQKYVKKGLNATIAIPSYVVGAGEIDSNRFGIFKSIMKGRVKFTFPGGGGTIAVEDMVEALKTCMQKGKVGERYIFVNENIKLFDMYNLIARILKKPPIKVKLPRMSYIPVYLTACILQKTMKNPPATTEMVRWFFNYRFYSSKKAQSELGWKPKISLEESFKRAIKYYYDTGVIKNTNS